MNPKKEITESQILFLKLHLFEDKKYADISEILDISIEKIREWWNELETELEKGVVWNISTSRREKQSGTCCFSHQLLGHWPPGLCSRAHP